MEFVFYHYKEENYRATKIRLKKVDFISQSKIKDYLNIFKKQLEKFNKVLCITTSSKFSDSYLVARKAKEETRSIYHISCVDVEKNTVMINTRKEWKRIEKKGT